MSFPEAWVDEVLSKTSIVKVIRLYIKIDKKGNEFIGLCPFHKEKTPSFTVFIKNQKYYCYGCGKGGSVIRFLMECNGWEFYETVKFLAKRAKIKLPYNRKR